jgi:hypothetical protein
VAHPDDQLSRFLDVLNGPDLHRRLPTYRLYKRYTSWTGWIIACASLSLPWFVIYLGPDWLVDMGVVVLLVGCFLGYKLWGFLAERERHLLGLTEGDIHDVERRLAGEVYYHEQYGPPKQTHENGGA